MGRVKIEPGDRYGFLEVIEEVEPRMRPEGWLRRQVLCRCDCGNEKVIPLDYLRKKGTPPACGCHQGDNLQPPTTHGWSRHPLYRIWGGMIGRCETPTAGGYSNYGGRGIGVCAEWHDADVFIRWALSHGWRKGLQIDRRNNEDGYHPSNCQFVTASANQRNTRSNHLVTFNDETLPLAGWAEKLGLSFGALSQRINIRKWPLERALTEPVRTKRKNGASRA